MGRKTLAIALGLLLSAGLIFAAPAGKMGVYVLAKISEDGGGFDILPNPSIAQDLVRALSAHGGRCFNPGTPPMKSLELLEYTIVENAELQGKEPEFGELHLEADGGTGFTITAGSGGPAYTKMEITEIHWVLDTEAILQDIQTRNLDYAVLCEVQALDQTSNFTPKMQRTFGAQRSIRCELQLQLVDQQGLTLESGSEERVTMSANMRSAANETWEELIENTINNWYSNE